MRPQGRGTSARTCGTYLGQVISSRRSRYALKDIGLYRDWTGVYRNAQKGGARESRP